MNQNKVFLGNEVFENGRLNKSIFTNLSKGLNETEFNKQFNSDKFEVFEKSIVENWIKDTYESTGGEIVKGSFNDIPAVHATLESMKNTVSLLKSVIVETEQGTIKELLVLPKEVSEEIEKSKNNEIEKGKTDELEKGRIADALNYGETKFTFFKKGSEIKEKLQRIKGIEQSKLIGIQAKISELEPKLAYKPTETNSYEPCCDEYKTFKWDMTYIDNDNRNVIQLSDTQQGTLTKEECENNRCWNDLIYSCREIQRELDAINLLEENLEDDKEFELTARQMLNFGF